MKRIGLLFPGQGSQYVGMGRGIYERFEAIKMLFEEADEVIGLPISRLCFEGPEDELKRTQNTQPALLLVSYATWLVLRRETGITPYLAAGHSLGEYTALLASGLFTFRDAISITRRRGVLMEEACPKGKGGMVALIGPVMERITPILKEVSHGDYVAVPANFNSREQVVLSGDINALKEVVERLKGHGYKKAVFLNVSGPFHSPLMEEAAKRLKEALMGLDIGEMAFPVVTNVDATPERQTDNILDKLYRQISSPVLWEDSIKRMVKEGVEVFLEVGPQKVLTNLARRIEPNIPCYNVEGYDDIEAIMGVIR